YQDRVALRAVGDEAGGPGTAEVIEDDAWHGAEFRRRLAQSTPRLVDGRASDPPAFAGDLVRGLLLRGRIVRVLRDHAGGRRKLRKLLETVAPAGRIPADRLGLLSDDPFRDHCVLSILQAVLHHAVAKVARVESCLAGGSFRLGVFEVRSAE